MSVRVETAVILAAGMGTRLSEHWSGRPKGLYEIGGESLVARSVRLLHELGVSRVVLVAGHLAEAYHDFAAEHPGVEVVENAAYDRTGSMASLACALERVDADFVLLESDLFFEPRALQAVMEDGAANVLLASGPTGAGDEVYVEAPEGRLRGLSKERGELQSVAGEFVGILRISHPLAQRMTALYEAFVREHGHGQMAYETDALVAASSEHEVAVRVVPDLLWGELDDERHLRRLHDVLWPAWEKMRARAPE